MNNIKNIIISTDKLPNVTLAGKVYVPAPNCHFPRQLSEHILYLITKGTMKIYDNNELLELKPGDIHIFQPGTYQNGVTTDSDIEYFYAHFSTESKQDLITQENNDIILPNHFHITSNNLRQVAHDFDEFYHNFNIPSVHRNLDNQFQFMHLVIELESMCTNNLGFGPNTSPLVSEIKNYIHVNFASALDSTTFANYFQFSYDHLNRCFKKETGTTIFDYLNSYRINHSKVLLHSGMLTLKQIAEAIGFDNEFYYSRVFKKYTGMSPSNYRLR